MLGSFGRTGLVLAFHHFSIVYLKSRLGSEYFEVNDLVRRNRFLVEAALEKHPFQIVTHISTEANWLKWGSLVLKRARNGI